MMVWIGGMFWYTVAVDPASSGHLQKKCGLEQARLA